MSRYWELRLRNGDGLLGTEGVHRREDCRVSSQDLSLGMGAEDEERPQRVLLQSRRGRLGSWTWKNGGRGEDLHLTALLCWIELRS